MGVFVAETLKLSRNRAVWGLVWIFPILFTVFFVIGLMIQLGHGVESRLGAAPLAAAWIAETTGGWKAAASGPARLLIGAFAALAFGGEYGWNTWKLIVPHRRRLWLIAAKYVVVVGLLMAAFLAMAILAVIFGFLGPAIRGLPVSDGIGFGALLAAHARMALVALISTLLSVGYGSAAAVVLRSTLGGAIVSVVAVTAEGALGATGPLLNRTLFLALPSYHIANLNSWILNGFAAPAILPSGILQLPWTTSLAVVGSWIVVLFAVTTITFDRQDLN